jgi:hypothetical protein
MLTLTKLTLIHSGQNIMAAFATLATKREHNSSFFGVVTAKNLRFDELARLLITELDQPSIGASRGVWECEAPAELF